VVPDSMQGAKEVQARVGLTPPLNRVVPEVLLLIMAIVVVTP